MTGVKARVLSQADDEKIAGLLSDYRVADMKIAELESGIARLRQRQAEDIARLHEAGLTYREIAPLIGRTKSRVYQLEHGK